MPRPDELCVVLSSLGECFRGDVDRESFVSVLNASDVGIVPVAAADDDDDAVDFVIRMGSSCISSMSRKGDDDVELPECC